MKRVAVAFAVAFAAVGDSYQIATGVVHDVKATSGAKVVAVYTIPKGQPLATPAP